MLYSLRVKLSISLAMLCTVSLCSCSEKSENPAPNEQLVDSDEAPELDIRELATGYRDEWVATHAREDDRPYLEQGEIEFVEPTEEGWHVQFKTYTYGGPEGKHIYYLHVYLNEDGSLDRVQRGPDLLS